MKIQHNIFSYATAELSQDAFLCWFFSFARKDLKANEEDPDGKISALAKKFLRDAWPEKLGNLSDADLNVSAVLRQYKNIDVLVKVNEIYNIIIEDKTGTNVHNDQINVYAKSLMDDNIPQENICCVFYKTMEQSWKEPNAVNRTRQDMLALLNQYDGDNMILLSYSQHLQDMEDASSSWRHKPTEQWDSWAWMGFFRHLSENGLVDYHGKCDGYGYVPNPSGGFHALWWECWRDGDWQLLKDKGLAPAIDNLYLQMTSEGRIYLRYHCVKKHYSVNVRKWTESWFARHFREKYGIDFILPARRSPGTTGAIGFIPFGKENYKEIVAAMEAARNTFMKSPDKFPE